jgi:protein CpxP
MRGDREINAIVPVFEPNRHKSAWRRAGYAGVVLIAGGVSGVLLYQSAGAWAQGGPPGRPAPVAMQEGSTHDGPGLGGFLLPTPVELAIDRALWNIDATTEQRKKITAIAERAADDLFDLREKHRANVKQIGDALAAATVDRAKIEMLRSQEIELANAKSQRVTAALIEAAEVLTSDQRATLAKRIESRRRWFRE